MAGRPKKLLDATSKNWTKEELEERRKAEEALYEHETLDMSDVPVYLDEIATAEWVRILPLLQKLPISELDRTAVAQYCVYTSIFQQATEDINERGSIVGGKTNPSINILNNASKELKGLANSLGLNIGSRLKIVVPEPEEKENDPFMNLMDDDE